VKTLKFQLDNFPQIYQKLKNPILQYVLRTVRDGETAEEITQEVFLKAYRARDTFDEKRGFTTWLWTIARNTVCDWHRKNADEHWRFQNRALADGLDGEAVCETLPSTSPDAEALISRHGDRRVLWLKLKSLTKLQRRVLWLRVVRGLSYQEIAKRLGMSISAAKCAFYRARIALSQLPEPAFA